MMYKCVYNWNVNIMAGIQGPERIVTTTPIMDRVNEYWTVYIDEYYPDQWEDLNRFERLRLALAYGVFSDRQSAAVDEALGANTLEDSSLPARIVVNLAEDYYANPAFRPDLVE